MRDSYRDEVKFYGILSNLDLSNGGSKIKLLDECTLLLLLLLFFLFLSTELMLYSFERSFERFLDFYFLLEVLD